MFQDFDVAKGFVGIDILHLADVFSKLGCDGVAEVIARSHEALQDTSLESFLYLFVVKDEFLALTEEDDSIRRGGSYIFPKLLLGAGVFRSGI